VAHANPFIAHLPTLFASFARPTDQGVGGGAGAAAEGAWGPPDNSGDPEQLQALLADTLNKLPGLR
jgi:hypothetical protein